MVNLEGVLYVLLLLLPLATLQYDRDGTSELQSNKDALNLLRTMKRRVSNQLMLQDEADTDAIIAAAASASADATTDNDDDHSSKIKPLLTVKRRERTECRGWNDPCVPWSNDAEQSCCNHDRLVCRCNLWWQNCRCVSRAWGK
ncbi:uncharacterized protein [Littorina saxatilis]